MDSISEQFTVFNGLFLADILTEAVETFLETEENIEYIEEDNYEY